MLYCLDANVLIQAWRFYYSPDFCQDYWECLNILIAKKSIFITEEVFKEIQEKDDALLAWVKLNKDVFVRSINTTVEEKLKSIYSIPENRRLADSSKNRSRADPWVIAHAMAEKAIVVTKEIKDAKGKKIKIPDVCESMKVPYINDFEFIHQIGIEFSAKLK